MLTAVVRVGVFYLSLSVCFSAWYLKKTMQLGSPNLTQKCTPMSSGNPFILRLQKNMPAWAFALGECWLFLVWQCNFSKLFCTKLVLVYRMWTLTICLKWPTASVVPTWRRSVSELASWPSVSRLRWRSDENVIVMPTQMMLIWWVALFDRWRMMDTDGGGSGVDYDGSVEYRKTL